MSDQPAMLRAELEGSELPFRREVARRLDAIASRGSVGWTSSLTLTADGVTTTTSVESELVTSTCQCSFQPATPEAAALVGKVWVSALTPGTAWSGAEVGLLVVSHPPLLVGVVATFQISLKG